MDDAHKAFISILFERFDLHDLIEHEPRERVGRLLAEWLRSFWRIDAMEPHSNRPAIQAHVECVAIHHLDYYANEARQFVSCRTRMACEQECDGGDRSPCDQSHSNCHCFAVYLIKDARLKAVLLRPAVPEMYWIKIQGTICCPQEGGMPRRLTRAEIAKKSDLVHWLVVQDPWSRLIEARELPPGTDLLGLYIDLLAKYHREGWSLHEFKSDWARIHISKDGEKRYVQITPEDPHKMVPPSSAFK